MSRCLSKGLSPCFPEPVPTIPYCHCNSKRIKALRGWPGIDGADTDRLSTWNRPAHPNTPNKVESDPGFIAGLEEARQGAAEGGIPIGSALVDADSMILGRGHNMGIQRGGATLHAEISMSENVGRFLPSVYLGATCYTTLSPCDMCAGACIMYNVKWVVVGDNQTFLGAEELLKQKGIEIVVLDSDECNLLLRRFITEKPGEWNEDIGVV